MKIGIFGGSFNPPHKMHEKLAKELLKREYVDKIIYVPTGSKYEYKHNLISAQDRLNMLKAICEDNERLEVSDYELKDKVVYTCETLAYFRKRYPTDTIYFICGADNLSYIDKWKNGLDILENYKIIVIKREGQNIEELIRKFNQYQDNIIISNIVPEELSSTFIREAIKNHKDVSSYLNKNVLQYIEKRKLYEV